MEKFSIGDEIYIPMSDGRNKFGWIVTEPQTGRIELNGKNISKFSGDGIKVFNSTCRAILKGNPAAWIYCVLDKCLTVEEYGQAAEKFMR